MECEAPRGVREGSGVAMDILDVMKLAHDRALHRLRELHTRVEEGAADDEVAISVTEAPLRAGDAKGPRPRRDVTS